MQPKITWKVRGPNGHERRQCRQYPQYSLIASRIAEDKPIYYILTRYGRVCLNAGDDLEAAKSAATAYILDRNTREREDPHESV